MIDSLIDFAGYAALFILGVLIGRATKEEELSQQSQAQQDALQAVYNAPAEEVPAPVKRGRGRPKKNLVS